MFFFVSHEEHEDFQEISGNLISLRTLLNVTNLAARLTVKHCTKFFKIFVFFV